jgi:tripartite-type tricarboxylate transporter receptor subunit TctC
MTLNCIGRRRAVLSLLALAAACQASAEESWPARPLKLVVHTTPGSSSDETARLLAAALSKTLGQAITVDNRAGAGGAIGAEFVAKSAPDGYTLLAGASSVMVTGPALTTRKLPYDPDQDFVPIGRVSLVPYLLVVNANSNVRTVGELVDKAKAAPGRVSYATAGVGTNNHLLGELMNTAYGINLMHVPYKGPAPAQTDLLGGVVDMQFDTQSTTMEFIKAGKLRALATSGPTRPPGLPNVPTFAELGFPQMQLQGWNALYAPRASPAPVVKRLQDALRTVQGSPEMQARLVSMGQVPDNLIGNALLEEQRKGREALRKFAESKNIALD